MKSLVPSSDDERNDNEGDEASLRSRSTGRGTTGRVSAVKQYSPCRSGRPVSRRITTVVDYASCSAGRALSLLVLVPILASSMEIVPMHTNPATVLSTLSIACTAAWYLAGTSASLAAVSAVPGIVEVVVGGVEEVVDSAVEGSKMVVRCISLGITFIAAFAVVKVGTRFLAALGRRISGTASSVVHNIAPDHFLQAYGGRLRGGGRGLGLTVKEVFGRTAPAVSVPANPVDPEKVEVGDEFSFIYYRGTRSGQRRSVILKEKRTTPTGIQFICEEMDVDGNLLVRHYWPSSTADPIYPEEGEVEELVVPAGAQSSGRVTASTLPDSSVGSSIVARTKAALQQSTVGWKAPRSLIVEQRGPLIKFYSGSDMLPTLMQELRGLTSEICGFQYQSDHTECIVQLVVKLTQGVKGRIIFDRSNFLRSSCARQAPRVSELWDAGCEMKVMKPAGGGFACMHVKTLIFDNRVVLTGSVNMTHNGHENNKEHLFRISEPRTVADVLSDFEEEWKEAEPVTEAMITKMLALHAEKKEKKDKDKQRDVSRSLSVELDEA